MNSHRRKSSQRLNQYPQARAQLRSISRMKIANDRDSNSGKIGWALLWLVGVPMPVLLIIFLLRGCT